jgi:predicted MFS family arabinose efflux permease
VQLLTLSCGGLMFIVLGQMRSYHLICVFTFLLAVINESFRPANAVAIAHYSREENRTRSFSLNRLAINLGWAFGGSLGGFIAAHNYGLLFIIDGCTNIGAAILLRIFLSPAKQSKAERANKVKAPRFEAFRDTRYMMFILLVFLFAFSFFQLFTTLPVFYRTSLHLPEQVIGGTMAGNGLLIALFEMVLIFRLEGSRHPLQFIPYGTLLVALSFIVFNIMPGGLTVAIISMLLLTAGEIFSMPFMNTYWISRTNDANRGQYAGLFTVAWASAQVSGPPAGAFFADKFGFTALWWLIGGIAVLVAAGYWLLHRAEEKTESALTRTE